MSAAEGFREGTMIVLELKDVPLVMLDAVEGKFEFSMADASESPAAAAMTCGLNGLADELVKLPFLERCMPFTMLVFRWWLFASASIDPPLVLPLYSRGDKLAGCPCDSEKAALRPAKKD